MPASSFATLLLVARRLLAVPTFAIGLLAGLLAVADGAGIEGTIAKSQALDRDFRATAEAIDGFRDANGRWPAFGEIRVPPASKESPFRIEVHRGGFPFCDGDTAGFDGLREDEYVVTAWRGDWYECYAPSRDLTTLRFDPRRYTMTGSIARDRAVYAMAALFCILGSVLLWRHAKQARVLPKPA